MADLAMNLVKVAVSGCRSRLDASGSDSSAISVGCPKTFSLRKANAGPSTMWTDEKHNLYLNSLEESFVKELQQSIAFRVCPHEIMRGARSYQQLPSEDCTCSPQLGLRHGRCTKDKNEPLLESTADSNILQRNTRICCFTSACKWHNAASHVAERKSSCCSKVCHEAETSGVTHGFARSSELQPTCCLCNLVAGGVIEVSDQNFVDEGNGEMLCSVSTPKRLKTVEADASSDDQNICNVVPFGKSTTISVSTVSGAFSDR
ncbi:hypothetical protein K2173_001155 [Erythroxylum novogranatense]|uniref:Uncharacterized protein n=1 Tax=Erythroxylum novogranatense TaxID=1862640 RepID=A0AAV8TKR6_9ROSI|nr:hypothetical protein K2173_001155 [Erythroxylum novogranatense]